jgi:hypothetical protein
MTAVVAVLLLYERSSAQQSVPSCDCSSVHLSE